MAGVPSMIHFLAISLLLACIAGMVSKPPTPEMTKKLCQLIKARFINDTPSGSFVEAVDEALIDAGLGLSPESHQATFGANIKSFK